ncbi:extensin [Biomphalaria pfeifferi]|uniref:Extensin n=1 Tax=Biomphalaria pfeifferi TaxID=112525 RepID=A0AAD8BKS6_BIOPF|nr:extensin [Biomphalaria pfeifferi]
MTHQWHLVVGILGTLWTVTFSHTGSCSYSTYGCCPDGITPAEGYGNKGCYPSNDYSPKPQPNQYDYTSKPPTYVGGCISTRYRCCPDGRTAASGYGNKGCYPSNDYSPKPQPNQYDYTTKPPAYVSGCISTKYGCCPDGRTAASGYGNEECDPSNDYSPKPHPKQYDDTTKPPTYVGGCISTRYGCCPDGRTAASGYGNEGCYPSNDYSPKPQPNQYDYTTKPPTYVGSCISTRYGCCPDGRTAASGYGNKGCYPSNDYSPKPQPNQYDYTTKPPTYVGGCISTRYGCCPDGRTAASGYGNKGCYPSNDYSPKPQPNQYDDTTKPPTYVGGCISTRYGCCPDGRTAASGYGNKGCYPSNDYSPKPHPKQYDDTTKPPTYVGGCISTRYGCCPDGRTAASGYGNEGCYQSNDYSPKPQPNQYDYTTKPPTYVGGCISTRYGCCPDGRTAASGYGNKGCYPSNDYSPKPQPNQYDDTTKPPTYVGGCISTRYGCCPDGRTAASGYGNKGCYPSNDYSPKPQPNQYDYTTKPPTYVGGCISTRYGCCPDGRTAASGYGNKGCYPSNEYSPKPQPNQYDYTTKPPTYVGGCISTRYGCCPDGRTAASGYGNKGCYPSNDYSIKPQPNQYDYTTKPPAYVSGCKSTRYGCCPDGRTAASGYGNKGCYPSNDYSPKPQPNQYDYTTKPPAYVGGCISTRYGCCPDGRTAASGYGNEGCYPSNDYSPKPQPNQYDYTTKPPTYVGGCISTRYGCCPDGRTAASGYGNEGCYPSNDYSPKPQPNQYDYTTKPPTYVGGCISTRYGCCPDGRTGASGSENRGCY